MVVTVGKSARQRWYPAGLRFECAECGGCCAGPQPGYIWITAAETEKLADFLGLTNEQVRTQYLERIGKRHTIVEDKKSRDCIFLKTNKDGKRGCSIYAVRPLQCRTWPFWAENLSSPLEWELAGRRCPGIGRGRLYSPEEIGRQGDGRFTMDDLRSKDVAGLVEEVYRQLQSHIGPAGQNCRACGDCCNFEAFGHRLYITSPEMIYFREKLNENNTPVLQMAGGVCPYRSDGKCSVYASRFAACRIFQCRGDKQAQNKLGEWAVEQMKTICRRFNLEYRYQDLPAALNG